jgi:DNA-binding transcriptional LysR family regulator
MKLIDIDGEFIGEQVSDSSLAVRNARMYDSRRTRITLKQWRMLHAVIDCNGFSAAAEYLHVSQSAISYTLARMQEQLGIALLKVEGRKAHVTEEGRMLMEYSRNMIRSAIELETLAEKMRLGWEPALRLMVDSDCPQIFVMAALSSFSRTAPHVKVSLQECSGATAESAIMQNAADLAICANVPPGLIADRLISVDYAVVVHPSHPLAKSMTALTDEILGRHTRIVLGSKDGPQRPGDSGCAAGKAAPWQVGSLDTALAALEAGLGYAWLPLNKVEHLVSQGRLQLLSMPAHYLDTRDFYLVHAQQASPGVGASRLSGLLHSHALLLHSKQNTRTECRSEPA